MARIFTTVLIRSGECRYLCHVPHTKEKIFDFLPLNLRLPAGFFEGTLYQIEKIHFYSWFAESLFVLIRNIVNFFQMPFLCTEMTRQFFITSLLT
jgi:hypothetical protein